MINHDSNEEDRTNFRQTAIIREESRRVSQSAHDGTGEEQRPLRPLITAADVVRGAYTEVEFGDETCCMIREHAVQRAPNRRSVDRHLIGVAGELAVATWLDVRINTKITEDFEGDGGYDLDYTNRDGCRIRVEVKTTRKQEPEGQVKRARIDDADLFVLCRANRGADRIEIIGYARRAAVKEFGEVYGLNGYRLMPGYLHPTVGERIPPGEVRNGHYRDRY